MEITSIWTPELYLALAGICALTVLVRQLVFRVTRLRPIPYRRWRRQ